MMIELIESYDDDDDEIRLKWKYPYRTYTQPTITEFQEQKFVPVLVLRFLWQDPPVMQIQGFIVIEITQNCEIFIISYWDV